MNQAKKAPIIKVESLKKECAKDLADYKDDDQVCETSTLTCQGTQDSNNDDVSSSQNRRHEHLADHDNSELPTVSQTLPVT